MERREALRLLAAAATLPRIPGELFALLRTARSAVESDGRLHALNAKQNALVTRMAELILPETDTPGATAAHVNQFIDLILSEWYGEEERRIFLDGLNEVDAACQKSFGKNFTDCDNPQQVKLLGEFDQAMASEAAALRSRPHGQHSEVDIPARNFIYRMKQLTLTGYFTSELGAKQALHFQMVPGHYDGCASIGAAGRGK